jgi:glycosyltransferase involved in cell wall biosynthesis
VAGAAAVRLSLDVSAVPAQPAGAGRYTVELARGLSSNHDEIDLTLVTRQGDTDRWSGIAPRADVAAAAPDRRPLRLAWEQTGLPRLLAKVGADVHQSPHYTMPEMARLPRVVTIHDCTFFDHPEWHERSKVILFRRAIRVAAHHAEALVCVSATTERELRAAVSVTAPTFVVHHGVDHNRFRPDEPEPGADERALALLGLRQPYVAFVGTIEPRKDVPSLIRAFDRIAERHRDLTLLLAGGPGWGMREATEALKASRHRDRVVQPGYVDDTLVPSLLRCASAVCYPSLAEGFGLPALEAMACGAPLVTTKGTSMEEVTGDAARLVRPGDVDELTSALDAAVTGEPGDAERRRDGIQLASAYTWAATASAHADIYRGLAPRR